MDFTELYAQKKMTAAQVPHWSKAVTGWITAGL